MNYLTRYSHEWLALLAGSSLPLAFAPYGLFPFAILSPAFLLLLWQKVSPKRAFWCGFYYGIGLFSFGISWVYISLYQFANVPWLGAIALTISLIIYMALYPALLGWMLVRYFPMTLANLLIFPTLWALMEWLRSWIFSGFPWLNLGCSQTDSLLSGFVPVVGEFGVSWLVAINASLLAYIWLNHRCFKKLLLPMLLAILLWLTGYQLSSVAWTSPLNQPIRVALLQGNIPQEFKWTEAFHTDSIIRYLNLSQQNRDADLIIWPETSIPLLYKDIQDYLPHFMRQLAFEHVKYKTDFLIGVPFGDFRTRYFNSVLNLSDSSHLYFKRHLVPFGEYIPFQSLFDQLLHFFNVPMTTFTAGFAKQANFQTAGTTLGITICYEAAFTELVRSSLPSAALLVNVSNDAWFGYSIAPFQHLQIARMRALENGRYLLRATNTGISAVIDAKGKVIAQSPQFKIDALRTLAQPYQGITPYSDVGNPVIIVFLWLILGITIFLTRKY